MRLLFAGIAALLLAKVVEEEAPSESKVGGLLRHWMRRLANRFS